MDQNEYESVLLDLRTQAESEFEKLIVYISAGSLGLTITFSEKIISIDKTGQLQGWLFLSWAFFATTILFCVLFHYSSIRAIDASLSSRVTLWNSITKGLHLLSICFIVAGVTCFVVYAILSVVNYEPSL